MELECVQFYALEEQFSMLTTTDSCKQQILSMIAA